MTEQEFHQATEPEMNELAKLLQVHTALGRVALHEVVYALQFARANGYTIFKHDEEPTEAAVMGSRALGGGALGR